MQLTSKTLLALASLLTAAQAQSGPPLQDPNLLNLPGCYPTPEICQKELKVLRTSRTPNGFHDSARGWNSFPAQANPLAIPGFTGFNQGNVSEQCFVMADPDFHEAGFTMCSLDSGWSLNNGDQFGRLLFDPTLFNIPQFAEELHSKGLQLGVYVLPGALCSDGPKTIENTNIILNSTFNGNNDGFLRCDFDFTKPGVQQWHNSVVQLFASWGVDMIKLDFVTPGSPDNGAHLVADNSGAVTAYHKAIEASGRDIRLDISWKLCRNDTFYDIWKSAAETMRTDQDINNSGSQTLVAYATVQRAIDNYRQYIALQLLHNDPLTIYPDMDNLFVGNPADVTGVTDDERYTIMNHWVGAAANLISGSDLTNLDSLGRKLLTSPVIIEAANFAAQYPMQPRNPGTGCTDAKQLQTWINGPDNQGNAYVLLANYGPDQGQGGFNETLSGPQKVSVSLQDLGIERGCNCLTGKDVWTGERVTILNGRPYTATLSEGQSQYLQLQRC